MTTAVDTDVIIALWDKDPDLSLSAQNALESASQRGTLVAAAPVFAELIAVPGRSKAFVDSFFEETGIAVDWSCPRRCGDWRDEPFKNAERRRRQHDSGARRILVDFVIGAHAFTNWISASQP